MNWFVFLYNMHIIEEALLNVMKIWSFCFNTDSMKYFTWNVPLLMRCVMNGAFLFT
jgi:hypothetical protein